MTTDVQFEIRALDAILVITQRGQTVGPEPRHPLQVIDRFRQVGKAAHVNYQVQPL
jgi:hypothetical protein